MQVLNLGIELPEDGVNIAETGSSDIRLYMCVYMYVCVCVCVCVCGPVSSVGIATELQDGRSGARNPVGTRFSVHPDRPPVKWVPGLSRG